MKILMFLFVLLIAAGLMACDTEARRHAQEAYALAATAKAEAAKAVATANAVNLKADAAKESATKASATADAAKADVARLKSELEESIARMERMDKLLFDKKSGELTKLWRYAGRGNRRVASLGGEVNSVSSKLGETDRGLATTRKDLADTRGDVEKLKESVWYTLDEVSLGADAQEAIVGVLGGKPIGVIDEENKPHVFTSSVVGQATTPPIQ